MISRGKAEKQAARSGAAGGGVAREPQTPQGAGARPGGGCAESVKAASHHRRQIPPMSGKLPTFAAIGAAIRHLDTIRL